MRRVLSGSGSVRGWWGEEGRTGAGLCSMISLSGWRRSIITGVRFVGVDCSGFQAIYAHSVQSTIHHNFERVITSVEDLKRTSV